MAQAIDPNSSEAIFHKLMKEDWNSILVQRNIFATSKQELEETQQWAKWCRENVGPMYDNYMHDYDGTWFGVRTDEEVQQITGIKYALAFKSKEDLMMFKLRFGIA